MSPIAPYLLISKAGYKLVNKLGQEKNWDILLIYDKNTKDNYAKCGAFLDFLPKNTLIIWHENAGNNGFLTRDILHNWLKDGKIKKYLTGMHDIQTYNGYAKLSFLIDAWDDTDKKFKPQDYDKAKEELVKWFHLNEKLNAALEFLHDCLGDNIGDTKILTDAGFVLNAKVNGKSIQELINEFTKGFKIPALKELRDALLEIAMKE